MPELRSICFFFLRLFHTLPLVWTLSFHDTLPPSRDRISQNTLHIRLFHTIPPTPSSENSAVMQRHHSVHFASPFSATNPILNTSDNPPSPLFQPPASIVAPTPTCRCAETPATTPSLATTRPCFAASAPSKMRNNSAQPGGEAGASDAESQHPGEVEVHVDCPAVKVGDTFSTFRDLKACVRLHSILNGYSTRFVKSD
jgi:hypothetical protein